MVRGCYPREKCSAEHVAKFCSSRDCIPQGNDGECSKALFDLTGHGISPGAERRGVSSTNRHYYGASSYARLLPFFERTIGEPVVGGRSHFGYWGQWVQPITRSNYNPVTKEFEFPFASIEGG